MRLSSIILETDNSINRNGGLVWNRLHSEREDICEALLKEPGPRSEAQRGLEAMSREEITRTANWHRELLQARLRKIDDALDRLMSGSYGHCSKCGRWIEDTKLEFDPAIAFCIACWQRIQDQASTKELTGRESSDPAQSVPKCELREHFVETSPSLDGVALETLAPFDTIRVRTLYSEYRIFLLDPKTGRVIVQGGRHFIEPVDATVNGSVGAGSIPKVGWIGVGCRLEMMVSKGIVSTSPVQSFHVDNHVWHEPESVFSSVM